MPRARRRKEEPEREDRITFEIVVDAYNETERGWSWYYYLEEHLAFPFRARGLRTRDSGPLLPGEEVRVLGMAQQDADVPEIAVSVKAGRRKLAVHLEHLECIGLSAGSSQAVEDWRYWLERGYAF